MAWIIRRCTNCGERSKDIESTVIDPGIEVLIEICRHCGKIDMYRIDWNEQ